MSEVLNVEVGKAAGMCRAAQSACWWWPHKQFVMICERPESISLTDGRLHNDDGMAIRFRDGWGLWAIHGVIVDEQIVMRPELQTLAQIESEANAEVKRVRIERYGWLKYLNKSGAAVVDAVRNDRDAQHESLYRMRDGAQRFVCIDPSTGRKYALGVPREIKTCEQARNWMSHDLDALAIHRS